MELNDLSKSGLVSLATEYSDYIKNDECGKNIITINPMSIDEYLNSKFFSYDKISDRVKSKVISFEDEYADIFTETSADIMNVFEDVLGEHNMKTEDILNLDCTDGNNLEQINKFLWKVKPVARILEKNHYTKTKQAPLELLEQALHGIMLRYGYRIQGINT